MNRVYLCGSTSQSLASHSSRLQPSIVWHASVTTFMFGCSGTQIVVVVVVAEHLYSAPGVLEPQKRSWLPHKVCFQILLKSLQTNIQVPHIRWKSVPKTRPRYRETSIAVALESPRRTDEISSSSWNEGFDDRSLISRSGMIQQDMSELHRPSSSGRKDRSWTELAGE